MRKGISEEEKQRAINGLTSLGLPLAEARTYVALLGQGTSEATPLSKIARVPQPKIYSYLESLENKGYIVKMDITGRSNLYKSLPYEVVLDNLKQQMEEHLQSTETVLKRLQEYQREEPERDYITVVQGENSIRDGLRDLFSGVPQNLLVFDTGYFDPLLEDLKERFPTINIIKPFEDYSQNVSKFPPFLKQLLASPAIDQIRNNHPLLIFEEVSDDFTSCNSTSIVGHPAEDEEPLFIRITHRTIVDFQIKMVKVLLDLLKNMVTGEFE